MIRFSEVVLPGHPDKLCDRIADAVLRHAYRHDPEAYGQVEVCCWCDEFTLTGGVATRSPVDTDFGDLVREVGRQVGYDSTNAVDAARWNVRDLVCRESRDPRHWTRHCNDQCIIVGYAGYDHKTRFLPPEHHLAHGLGERLFRSMRSGRLKGHGPDGKLLVRMREEGSEWILEHVLCTVQQLESTPFAQVCGLVALELESVYEELRAMDARWVRPWSEVEVLVNPNGPLVNGGPDGDNGQTGRKLVMDYYGPRVPIGGGALYGKDFSHIDRLGAVKARHAAVHAVQTGAREALVRVAYAPNLADPLDVCWELQGIGERAPRSFFRAGESMGHHPHLREIVDGLPALLGVA